MQTRNALKHMFIPKYSIQHPQYHIVCKSMHIVNIGKIQFNIFVESFDRNNGENYINVFVCIGLENVAFYSMLFFCYGSISIEKGMRNKNRLNQSYHFRGFLQQMILICFVCIMHDVIKYTIHYYIHTISEHIGGGYQFRVLSSTCDVDNECCL